LEKARGTPEQASVYCKKDESREGGTEFEEFGQLPSQGRRSDLDEIACAIRSGSSIQEVANQFPSQFIRYQRGIEGFQAVNVEPRKFKTEVFWLYGATGTGKSYWASVKFPEAYWKMGGNKWWDGYVGQDAVIIDDYRRDLCAFHELLRMLDRNPYKVERKGSAIEFRARSVVITTPKHPRLTWEGRTDEELGQLLRRVEHVGFFRGVEDAILWESGLGVPSQYAIGFNPLFQQTIVGDVVEQRKVDDSDNASTGYSLLLSDIGDGASFVGATGDPDPQRNDDLDLNFWQQDNDYWTDNGASSLLLLKKRKVVFDDVVI
jgi:hypothetical protein